MAEGKDQIFVESEVTSYITDCNKAKSNIASTYSDLRTRSQNLVGDHWKGESADAWLNFVEEEVKDAFDKIDEYLEEMIKVVTDMRDLKMDSEHQIAGITPNS